MENYYNDADYDVKKVAQLRKILNLLKQTEERLLKEPENDAKLRQVGSSIEQYEEEIRKILIVDEPEIVTGLREVFPYAEAIISCKTHKDTGMTEIGFGNVIANRGVVDPIRDFFKHFKNPESTIDEREYPRGKHIYWGMRVQLDSANRDLLLDALKSNQPQVYSQLLK